MDGRLVVVANQELPELEHCIEKWYFLCLSLILQSRLHRVWRSILPEQDHFAQVVEVTKLRLNSSSGNPLHDVNMVDVVTCAVSTSEALILPDLAISLVAMTSLVTDFPGWWLS